MRADMRATFWFTSSGCTKPATMDAMQECASGNCSAAVARSTPWRRQTVVEADANGLDDAGAAQLGKSRKTTCYRFLEALVGRLSRSMRPHIDVVNENDIDAVQAEAQ
jgi:hypothetical protein